jgi:hypothetical protein
MPTNYGEGYNNDVTVATGMTTNFPSHPTLSDCFANMYDPHGGEKAQSIRCFLSNAEEAIRREPERNALQFIYDALQIPELVSSDPGERFMAQQRLDLAKAFPTFQMKDDTPSLGERKQGKKSKKNIKKERGGGGKGFGS